MYGERALRATGAVASLIPYSVLCPSRRSGSIFIHCRTQVLQDELHKDDGLAVKKRDEVFWHKMEESY